MTEEKFTEIIDRYANPIVNIINRMIGKQNIAYDLAQDVFIKIWENRSQIDPNKPVFTFLYRLAMNHSIDYIRKKKEVINDLEYSEFSIDNPDEKNEELLELIIKCSQYLKPKQKAVFILRDIEGFKFEEIADTLQESLSNIRSNLHLARKKIRELLETKYSVTRGYFYEM